MRKTQQRTEVTKRKILKAAKKLFLQHGFAGTAMGRIAEAAEVNHSLLFHHFGNKEQLWVAVKQFVVEQANKKQPIVPSTDLAWPEFVEALLHNSYQFYMSSNDIRRLINWQRLEKESKRDMKIGHTEEALEWLNAITHYKDMKSIRSELEPAFIMTMVVSLTVHVALDPNYFLRDAKSKQAYFDFCRDSIVVATIKASQK